MFKDTPEWKSLVTGNQSAMSQGFSDQNMADLFPSVFTTGHFQSF